MTEQLRTVNLENLNTVKLENLNTTNLFTEIIRKDRRNLLFASVVLCLYSPLEISVEKFGGGIEVGNPKYVVWVLVSIVTYWLLLFLFRVHELFKSTRVEADVDILEGSGTWFSTVVHSTDEPVGPNYVTAVEISVVDKLVLRCQWDAESMKNIPHIHYRLSMLLDYALIFSGEKMHRRMSAYSLLTYKPIEDSVAIEYIDGYKYLLANHLRRKVLRKFMLSRTTMFDLYLPYLLALAGIVLACFLHVVKFLLYI